MPAARPRLFPSEQRSTTALGGRLRLAKLRRQLTAKTVAARAGISRMTLYRAESGETADALGTYVRVLAVLHLEQDLALVAKDDVVGRTLQDNALPAKRRRAPAAKPVGGAKRKTAFEVSPGSIYDSRRSFRKPLEQPT